LKKLTEQELERISEAAASAAENFIFSQVSKKELLDLEVNLKILQDDELKVDVEVILYLDKLSKARDTLAEEATESAINAIDEFIKLLKE